MKPINGMQQGTAEWLALRAQYITASELDSLISPKKLEIRRGEEPNTYVCRKIAERWLGQPIAEGGGWASEQGSLLEQRAIPWYEKTIGADTHRPAFVLTDDESFGFSPDAMVGERGGAEIKCPQPINHVRWLSLGGCPSDHYLQVQGAMFVTGATEWDFVSYCEGFPHLRVTVGRDDALMGVIAEAVRLANEEIARGYDRLLRLNGAPPAWKLRAETPAPVEEEEYVF